VRGDFRHAGQRPLDVFLKLNRLGDGNLYVPHGTTSFLKLTAR
jgi:hypothetical protein